MPWSNMSSVDDQRRHIESITAEVPSATPTKRPGLSVGQATPTSNWVLPVAGMQSKPGDRSQGGNWARGSFGYQKPASKGGHIHAGTDIYADAGSSIVTPVAGTVIGSGYGKQSGHYIRIKGTDGIEYYFAHMQEPTRWERGVKVQAGINIGFVGNSGNASGTSPHLHFGMKKNGRSISPNEFLETGTQQSHTPLSAIPGLNTPEEIARWVKEELSRQSAANAEMAGFDAAGISGMIADDQLTAQQNLEGFGASFMRGTLEASSNSRMGGVPRVPVPRFGPEADVSSALTGGSDSEATGAIDIGNATNPALQRAASDTEETDATR